MTAQNDLDRALGAWFDGDATTAPPPEPLARAIDSTRHLRPRPVPVAWIGSSWIGSGESSGMRGLRPALLVALVALLALAVVGGALLVGGRLVAPPRIPHAYTDRFVSLPDLPTPVGSPIAVELQDGRVLVIGGIFGLTPFVYDPTTSTSVATGPVLSPNGIIGNAVGLRDGRVLLTGDGVSQVFDPATMSFTPTGPAVTARSSPMLAPLPDGRVLFAGGVQPGTDTRLHSAELFDPKTLTFSPTGSMTYDAGDLVTLPDGRVFVASSPNAEMYDPRSGTFAFAGVIPAGVTGATALPDGRVVLVGVTSVTGMQSDGFVGVWDPAEATYREVWGGSQSHPLWSATTLDDGRVLVTGGRPAAWAGVLDPATGQMKPVTPPAWSRPTVTRLSDGRVLIVGGMDDGAGSTVQVFQ